MKYLYRIGVSTAALFAASAAHAGGYVVPIIEAVPAVTASAGGTGPNVAWLAVPVVLCAIFCRGGGDRATLPPGDHGGPCFQEGTLISTDRGYRPIEDLAVGDLVTTSKGAQPILHIGHWTPTEFKDRAAVVDGIHMTRNHVVCMNGLASAAEEVTNVRAMIDGTRFFHILVTDHAWLEVDTFKPSGPLLAESMRLTADIKPLADLFPHLIAHHAAEPCDAPQPAI